MAMIHRRSFIERLGLGAGAVLLSPIANALVREARGQTSKRKRLLLVFDGNGFDYKRSFLPAGLDGKLSSKLFQTKDFGLPPAVAGLAPYRNKLLMLDGAANSQGPGFSAGHFKGYMGATCVPHIGSTPGGPSIDQVIGKGLAGSSPYRTINLSATPNANGGLISMVFAAGPGQPVPSITSPSQAIASIFAPVSGDQVGAALLTKRRSLLDVVRDDVKKLQSSLAGRERLKLEQYLVALYDIGVRQQKLESLKGCAGPGAPTTGSLEDNITAHFDIAAAALICGLTQVVTITSPGTGTIWAKLLGSSTDTHVIGHDNSPGAFTKRNSLHNFHAEQIARLCKKLEAVRENDGTMFDNSVAFFANHNAEGHHSKGQFYPSVLVGTGGGVIKADGRFIKFGGHDDPGFHSLGDVYCTIAHAMGVPTDSFGKSGNEKVTGAIPEIT
jgi:hypothetical protein